MPGRFSYALLSGLLAASSLLFCPLRTSGQSGAPAAKIGTIQVTGQKSVSSEQFVAATGLKPGQDFDPQQLNAAAEKLGKSGAFSDITYSYVSQGGLVAVDFKVQEGKFRPCYFDNFVWLSDEEIIARLKKELPLYNGMIPETGEMLDEVSSVLERLSKEKGVAVRVSRRVQQAAIGDANWSHMYVAEGAGTRVQAIRFTGALTVNQVDLQKEIAGLLGREYSVFQSKLFASSKILPFYRERGYLRAKVDTAAPRIVSHVEGSSEFVLEVVYAVAEGNVYRWSAPEWSGNVAFATASLDGLTGMKANDIANGKRIDEAWAAVQKEYSKSGYVEARVLPEPAFDEGSRLVHYRVQLTEGPQYHMGSFMVAGLPDAVAAKVKSKWRLKTGDVYDGSYASDFWKKDAGPALQGVLKPGIRVGIVTTPNKGQRTVDVTFKLE